MWRGWICSGGCDGNGNGWIWVFDGGNGCDGSCEMDGVVGVRG